MYRSVKVLDVHGHYSRPQAVDAMLARLMASNTAELPSPLSETGVRSMGLTEDDFRASTKRHIDLLDDHQIDVQLIGPRPFMMLGWMQPHLFPVWARFVNELIAKQVSLAPNRLIGAAALPQNSDAPDLSHCLPELDRCINELGFGAAYLGPDPGGRRTTPGMHEPYWFPVYERCQELDVPIIVHGTSVPLDRRFGIVPQNYQLGFVTETYLATQFLSHGDVFQRFPKLRIVMCHCGGALDRFIPTDPHLSQNDLSRNLFFDTCAYDLNFLEAAIKQRAPARMCFGTEVPGSGTAVRPETGRPGDDLVPAIGGFGFLSEDDKIAIFNTNPGRVCPALTKVV